MKVYGVDNRGRFWPQRIASISEDPWQSSYERRVAYDESEQALYYATDTQWVKITAAQDLFNVGQKIIWASSTLPDNWNLDTSFNDRIPIIVSSTSQIGSKGGTWIISGMQEAGGHNHGQSSPPTVVIGRCPKEVWTTLDAWYPHSHTFDTKGSHTHAFDGSWRPAHNKYIVGTYEGRSV